jgi:hypothetical protein
LITKTGYYAGSSPDSIAKKEIPEKKELPAVRDWFYGAGKQKQMFRSLFALKEARDFQTLMVPNIFLSPQGETVAVLSFFISPNSIRLKQEHGLHVAKFRLLLAVFNETGMIVAYWNQDYPLSLDTAQYEQFQRSGIRLGATINLRPGRYQVRSVIREWNSKTMSAGLFPLDVFALSKELPGLSSIVLSTGAAEDSVESGGVFNPLRFSNQIITPAAPGDYRPEGSLIIFFHAYNVSEQYRCRVTLYRDQVLHIEFPLTRFRSSDEHVGKDLRLATSVPLSSLTPGNYRLNIEVALPDGSNRVSRSATFRVN